MRSCRHCARPTNRVTRCHACAQRDVWRRRKGVDDLVAFIEDRVDRLPDLPGCWLWTQAWTSTWRDGRFMAGYGVVQLQKRIWGAHRLSYTAYVGPIPTGLWVLHRCDTPPCCNPAHLFLGTSAENTRDKWKKGRGPLGETHPMHRLCEDDVRAIRREFRQRGDGPRLAQRYGVHPDHIGLIVRRGVWQHLPPETAG